MDHRVKRLVQLCTSALIIIIIIIILIIIIKTMSADIYGASHICQSSLWFLWAKVGQSQVAANSYVGLQT